MLLRKKGERAVTRSEGDMTPGSPGKLWLQEWKWWSLSHRAVWEAPSGTPMSYPTIATSLPWAQWHCANPFWGWLVSLVDISSHPEPQHSLAGSCEIFFFFFWTKTVLNTQKKKQILNERGLLFPYANPAFERCSDKILLLILLDFILTGLKKIHKQDNFKGRSGIFVIKATAWTLTNDVPLDSVILHCASHPGPAWTSERPRTGPEGVSLGHGIVVTQLQSTRQWWIFPGRCPQFFIKRISVVINQWTWFIIAIMPLKSVNPAIRERYARAFAALGFTLGY